MYRLFLFSKDWVYKLTDHIRETNTLIVSVTTFMRRQRYLMCKVASLYKIITNLDFCWFEMFVIERNNGDQV